MTTKINGHYGEHLGQRVAVLASRGPKAEIGLRCKYGVSLADALTAVRTALDGLPVPRSQDERRGALVAAMVAVGVFAD